MTTKRKRQIEKQRRDVHNNRPRSTDERAEVIMARLSCALVFIILFIIAVRGF